MFKNAIQRLVAAVLIMGLVVPPTDSARELAGEVEALPSSSGLYRTQVAVRQPADWTRLERMGVTVLEQGEDWALVLADEDQLETLARLRFEPQSTDELGMLVTAHAQAKPWLTAVLATLTPSPSPYQVEGRPKAGVRVSLTPEQRAGLAALTSVDDDADGLTNTQEQWWCTDPLNPDSDGDGTNDGDEVQAAKDWLGNLRGSYPSTGKPFVGWPPDHAGCYDDDQDSIPDLAERWELGLNMNRESTDWDKFDDGQELFGRTYCPGSGGYCGYGSLPRDWDWGVILAEMPPWVKAPGNHPLVAAYPVPEINVVESSLHVETVTVVTTDHTISEGTERSYSTAKLEGTSTSVADTVTWNDWQEVSRTTPDALCVYQDLGPKFRGLGLNVVSGNRFGLKMTAGTLGLLGAIGGAACIATAGVGCAVLAAAGMVGAGVSLAVDALDQIDEIQDRAKANRCDPNAPYVVPKCVAQFNPTNETKQVVENQVKTAGTQDLAKGGSGTQYSTDGTSQVTVQPLIQVSYPSLAPRPTTTQTTGHSEGGAHTTTHTQYEEHTITNGEAFSSQESWGTATAVDSSHAAELWFTYNVRNTGTEYAREIGDLAFNIYIGDDPNPAYTYFVAPDLGGDGKFHNFMPDEEHSYTSRHISLTLNQMAAIDLGGPVRIVVEDYTYGTVDESFYQAALNGGVLTAIEDGTDDGDEEIDIYLIPTWGEETVLDVLARYFPHTTDADGNLIAVWTPEYRADTPAWCNEPNRVGTTLWCKHALSTADWWNVYLNGLGDGSEGFQDTPAAPGSVALFRFNKDSDLDGYSDRSEIRLGTDPNDPADHPKPELIAGVHSIRNGDQVVATLSLLNTGLYDAYGMEAVMIAPDDSVSITNNTVGGSGRVRALKQVIVGSRILPPSYDDATWQGTAQSFSSGYHTGNVDRTYTFTAVDSGDVFTDTLVFNWTDGIGTTGTLSFPSGYPSPTPLDVGDYGVKLGLLSGSVNADDSFTVEARTPRDTFQYAISSEPYTEPVVIVSYNDPQGNHRFVIPPAAMALSHPTDDLATYAGQMLQDPGVEIVTTAALDHDLSEMTRNTRNATAETTLSRLSLDFVPFAVQTPLTNTVNLVINNPTETTLTDAHLFLEFIDVTGTVASEVPVTVTLPAGPTVVPVTWDTADFDPPYDENQDYIVMAFWTDYQGNILDTAARPLSSFQEDPKPAFAMREADELWDFGTAAQGTLLRRTIAVGSVGFMDLLAYVGEVAGLYISGQGSLRLPPADMALYDLTLKTAELPEGPFESTLTIRTSDPERPTRTITIQGDVTPMPPDSPGSIDHVEDYPLPSFSTESTTWVDVPGFQLTIDSAEFSKLIIHAQTESGQHTYLRLFNLTDGSPVPGSAFSIEGNASGDSLVFYPASGSKTYILQMHGHDWSPSCRLVSGYLRAWREYLIEPYQVFGDGSGGDLVVPSGHVHHANPYRSALSATASAEQPVLTILDPSGFGLDDEVLVIQMQGSGAGNYEFGRIASMNGGTLTLEENLQHTYTVGGNSKAQVLRVPNYRNVTVQDGGTLTNYAWDGATGGIVVFRAKESLNVLGGGQITVKALGYGGGNHSSTQHVQGEQGESSLGLGTGQVSVYLPADPDNRNGAGGGGGAGDDGSPDLDGGGGGGGGYGSAGENGYGDYTRYNGQGGQSIGDPGLSQVYFGGGGGSGGNDHNDAQSGHGGRGGGMVIAYGRTVTVAGEIVADGANGGNSNSCSGSGGGGAGGTIWLIGKDIDIGTNRVLAQGGQGGSTGDCSRAGHGGNGGVGRIRIEYYDTAGSKMRYVRLPAQDYSNVTIDFTVGKNLLLFDDFSTDVPGRWDTTHGTWQVTNGVFDARGAGPDIDAWAYAGDETWTDYSLRTRINMISGNGIVVFRSTGHWENEYRLEIWSAKSGIYPNRLALDRYKNGEVKSPPVWDQTLPIQIPDTVDVQVDMVGDYIQVYLDGTKWIDLHDPDGLAAGRIGLGVIWDWHAQFDDVQVISLNADNQADGEIGSNNLSVVADVGDDGTIDWTYTGSASYPAYFTTDNLASLLNAHLSGHSGEVDMPVRFYLAPFLPLDLDDFSATPSAQPDVTVEVLPPMGEITESDVVTLTATLTNNGSADSGPLTVAFFATSPDGFGETYIGSAFVTNVPAGASMLLSTSGSADASIQWNTLGFTGDVPVRVVADPYNRVAETDDDNNEATTSLTILTRPDLHVTAIELSDPEPVAGQPVTVTLTISNAGQTDAGTSALALYDGNPDDGGTPLGEDTSAVGGESQTTLDFIWTPTAPGPHRLFTVSDRDDDVNEFDEGNNQSWEDVYAGFAAPLLLDSGTAGDVDYTAERGFGYVDEDEDDMIATCGDGIKPEETLRRDPGGQVVYRFDHLLAGHFYHLDVTLYECDGAGRQETVYVDGNLVAGPEDLGDGQVHLLSLRLDPALYADHAIEVTIEAPGIDGAVVGQVNLHDVDYRYADAGGANDPAYPGDQDYGWLDGVSNTGWGTLPYQSVRVDQGDDELRYRFDGLDPTKSYNVHLTFWQPSGTARIQKAQIDGLDTGVTVNSGDYQRHDETVLVPITAYADDGSIVVGIVRTNAASGAMVNEIALEEETLAIGGGCVAPVTPFLTEVYGSLTINDAPAPVGTVVQALSPRGDTVGCFTVETAGLYGFMRIYGEDATANPPIPGMRDGETPTFRLSGAPAVATPLFYWQDDKASHRVDLAAGRIEGQSIPLNPGWNLISFRVEPPGPLVSQVLNNSIEGQYDRVLGEMGIYVPDLPDVYNTLKELHSGEGYYLRLTGATSTNLLVAGLPQEADTPIPLHQGWNWIGYLPEAKLPVTQALQSIESHYQRVLSLDKTYDPALPEFSTLQEMQPGEGYLIYATDSVTLTYPAGGVGALAVQSPAAGVACDDVAPTPYLTLVYGQVTVNGLPAPVGTRVDVLTPRGEVAGCFVVERAGEYGFVHVYGADDTAEPPIPGFQEGEPLDFRVNGIPANASVALSWQDDKAPHEVDLDVTLYPVYLPLILKSR